MKVTSPPVIITLKVIFILVGFTFCLLGNQIDKQHWPTVLEGIISAVLNLLVAPFLIVLVVRLNVATGFLKPPWEAPTIVSNPFDPWNPLPLIQFGSFLGIAGGVGLSISIVWNGLQALGGALGFLSGGIAFHLGLIRLMKIYPALQNNSHEQQTMIDNK
jgi:hypothetical protein